MRAISLLFVFALTGCLATLSDAERVEYDNLVAQTALLKSKIQSQEKRRVVAFRKLSQLEKVRGMMAKKRAIACRKDLRNQRIGPFPFRFKKGYFLKFDEVSKRKNCDQYVIKVTK